MDPLPQPVLPLPGKRNILITSALPYVNNVAHLGNVVGSVLSADVFARYCRARGYQTLYVCGSDEYGTATETKALEEGLTPEELCSKYHAIHKEIYDWFRIDFDVFGRTPTPQHTEIVQEIFADLWRNGFIEERETAQPFCPNPDHESFLADRFVEGECSICHDLGARGDQCDKCGGLLDPFEPDKEPVASVNNDTAKTAVKQELKPESKGTGWLINPRCKLDGATPVRRVTKHLYLRLDALQPDIVSWLDRTSKEWSPNCIAITQSWIDKGLLPRSITRDLKWGVPIPKGLDGLSDEEYEKKVFYVWFDACIGYVSITKGYTDRDDLSGRNWQKWWKNPGEVSLYQFMGKDNVPFHTIIFPASQLGTRKEWTQVNRLSTTEYLNYEGGKFSKSKGIGVFGTSAKDTGIDVDCWRYYLLSKRPETSDSEFKWDEFITTNNNDLLKNLGNFCQRLLKFCEAKFDGTVPEARKYTHPLLDQHKQEVNDLLQVYIKSLEANKLRAGLSTVLSISALGNKVLQDNKLSNQLLVEDPERCAAVVSLALETLHLTANLISPYMPGTSESILKQLGLPHHPRPHFSIPDIWTFSSLDPGHRIGTPHLLFAAIPAERAEEWRLAYGGEELRKAKDAEAERLAAKKAAKLAEKEKKLLKKAKKAEEDAVL